MSRHIVDDEQRRDRPQHPCALGVPGGEGASAALALLRCAKRLGVRCYGTALEGNKSGVVPPHSKAFGLVFGTVLEGR